MTRTIQLMTSITLLAVIGMILPAYADGILYVGSDSFELSGVGPTDQIGKYDTVGPVAVGGNINLAPGDLANGMTILNGDLLTGTVVQSDLTLRDLNTAPKAAPFDADTPDVAFNEDLAYDGTSVWRAWFGSPSFGFISEHDPSNLAGAAIQTLPQSFGPVGMTSVGGNLWITDWFGQTVGTFDPVNNIYTVVFPTPSPAGCLAWDADSAILWVGLGGGTVVPYTLAGVPLNAGFQPFGGIIDTVDGCAFITPAEVEKTWTETDYNWDPICDITMGQPGFVNPADGKCYSESTFINDIGFRPANINNPGDDVLADSLDPDEDGTSDVVLGVKRNGKISNMNPGAIYALTTVVINTDLDMLEVEENYGDCTATLLELLNQKTLTRNVKVAVADPDGNITELTEELYDILDDDVVFTKEPDATSTKVKINDASHLTTGSTVYVLVKFDDQLKNEVFNSLGDLDCVNDEWITSTFDQDSLLAHAQATLNFSQKP